MMRSGRGGLLLPLLAAGVALALAVAAISWLHLTHLALLEELKATHASRDAALAKAEKELNILQQTCAQVEAEHEDALLRQLEPKPCEPRTIYAPASDESLGEMEYVRRQLLHAGWAMTNNIETAAFVLSAGDSPPQKRPCGSSFRGTRISGPFERELEVCQKHKLFERFSTRLSAGRQEDVNPDDMAVQFPWLPKTYLLNRPTHVAALNLTLPCAGSQEAMIVKGDAHGGRAIWLPKTNEELRKLVGMPCDAAKADPQGPDGQLVHLPRLVQRMIRSVLWDGQTVMGRVFLLVQRRGGTRLSVDRGRWMLGVPAPSYELQMFDMPLFTQYPGNVRDNAEEESVTRRNGSEFEAFVQAENARRHLGLPRDWVRTEFMRRAGEISAEAFAASATPYAWELSLSDDRSDSVKAASLEPDGAFMFVSAELLVDVDFGVHIIEFTCVPGDIQGLEQHFGTLPWARTYAEDLGAQLARVMLRNSGQDVGIAATSLGEAGRWTKLAERAPFPHP